MFQKDTQGDVLVMSVGAHCFQAGFRRIEGVDRIGDNQFNQYHIHVKRIHIISILYQFLDDFSKFTFFEFKWVQILRIYGIPAMKKARMSITHLDRSILSSAASI